ncbi:MAG: serine/threonine-protein kinase [Planctomycetota bacterium]
MSDSQSDQLSFPLHPDESLHASDTDPFELVENACEKYIGLHRDGVAPPIDVYAKQFPALEEDILEMLPTVMLLEVARKQNLSKRKDGRVVRGPNTLEQLGDYKIINELGRGGMGIVFEAYQSSLDRYVALKVLPRHLLKDDQKQRFFAEAKIVAKLHHSNIVPVYSVGEENDVCFYAMEKLSGIALDQYVTNVQELDTKSSGPIDVPLEPLTIEQVVDVGIQISDALDYAHEHGVIHRDVKPANLIRGLDGRVWLADFGLATRVDHDVENSSGSISGTLRYVAPERFDGAEDTPTIDIYSLGITLMELVTGRAAFSGHRRAELLEQIRANQFSPLRSSGSALSNDLIKILTKAASLDPSQRYATAGELRDDLIDYTAGRSVSANPMGPFRRALRWYQQNRALAAATILAVASLTAVAAVSSISYFQSRERLNNEIVLRSNATNASRVANQAVDEIFQQLHIGTGLAGVDSADLEIPEGARNTHLLYQLTRFYERMAANDNTDFQLPLDPVTARRRVGQLHLRLGNYEDAILAFDASLFRLERHVQTTQSWSDPNMVIEQSQIINEKGLAKRILGKPAAAKLEHQEALSLLTNWKEKFLGANIPPDQRPGDLVTETRINFELARSLYLQAHRTRPGMGPFSFPPEISAEPSENLALVVDDSISMLKEAIALLQSVLPENFELRVFDSVEVTPRVDFQSSQYLPDQLHLLALCYRELASDTHASWQEQDRLAHNRSISILKSLTQQYPNDATYRYDLVRALAEMDVLENKIRESDLQAKYDLLNEAISLSELLVQRYPSVSDFQMEISHANNKLAEVIIAMKSTTNDETELAQLEAELVIAYRRAWQHQMELVKNNPKAPAFKVWAAMFALKCAETESVRVRPDRRNRLVARASSVLNQLSSQEQQNPTAQALLKKAKQLSLLGLADPPAVNSQ